MADRKRRRTTSRRNKRTQMIADRRGALDRLRSLGGQRRGKATSSFGPDTTPGIVVPTFQLNPGRVGDMRRPALSPERESRERAERRQMSLRRLREFNAGAWAQDIGGAYHEMSEKRGLRRRREEALRRRRPPQIEQRAKFRRVPDGPPQVEQRVEYRRRPPQVDQQVKFKTAKGGQRTSKAKTIRGGGVPAPTSLLGSIASLGRSILRGEPNIIQAASAEMAMNAKRAMNAYNGERGKAGQRPIDFPGRRRQPKTARRGGKARLS